MKLFPDRSPSDFILDFDSQFNFNGRLYTKQGINEALLILCNENNWGFNAHLSQLDTAHDRPWETFKNSLSTFLSQSSTQARFAKILTFKDKVFGSFFIHNKTSRYIFFENPFLDGDTNFNKLYTQFTSSFPKNNISAFTPPKDTASFPELYSLKLLDYFLSRNSQNEYFFASFYHTSTTHPHDKKNAPILKMPKHFKLGKKSLKKFGYIYWRKLLQNTLSDHIANIQKYLPNIREKDLKLALNSFQDESKTLTKKQLEILFVLFNKNKLVKQNAIYPKDKPSSKEAIVSVEWYSDLIFCYFKYFFPLITSVLNTEQISSVHFRTFNPEKYFHLHDIKTKTRNIPITRTSFSLTKDGLYLGLRATIYTQQIFQADPSEFVIPLGEDQLFANSMEQYRLLKTRSTHPYYNQEDKDNRLGFIFHNTQTGIFTPFFYLQNNSSEGFLVLTSLHSKELEPIISMLKQKFPNIPTYYSKEHRLIDKRYSAMDSLFCFSIVLSSEGFRKSTPNDCPQLLNQIIELHEKSEFPPKYSNAHPTLLPIPLLFTCQNRNLIQTSYEKHEQMRKDLNLPVNLSSPLPHPSHSPVTDVGFLQGFCQHFFLIEFERNLKLDFLKPYFDKDKINELTNQLAKSIKNRCKLPTYNNLTLDIYENKYIKEMYNLLYQHYFLALSHAIDQKNELILTKQTKKSLKI